MILKEQKAQMTTNHKITPKRLREIIKEEIHVVAEAVDHKGISAITGAASKLLAAVEGFREKAPPSVINAVTPHLGELEKQLEAMLSNPGSYIPKPKVEPKRVSLKPIKKEGKGNLEEADARWNREQSTQPTEWEEPDDDVYPPEMERRSEEREEEPCPKCGSENTRSLDPIPSMMGHGSDEGLTCLDCKKTTWAAPNV